MSATATYLIIYGIGIVVAFVLRIPTTACQLYRLVSKRPEYAFFLNSTEKIEDAVAKTVVKNLHLLLLSWILVVVQIVYIVYFFVWKLKHKE